jgi:hypothetical protein
VLFRFVLKIMGPGRGACVVQGCSYTADSGPQKKFPAMTVRRSVRLLRSR